MPDSLRPHSPRLRKRSSTEAVGEATGDRKKTAKYAPANTGDTTADTTVDTVHGANAETATGDGDSLDLDTTIAKFANLKIEREVRRAEAFVKGNLLERRPRMRRDCYCCSCKCRVKVSPEGSCARCSHERCPECLQGNS